MGLQGAGKSSFYRAQFAPTHLHVSKDLWPNIRIKAQRRGIGVFWQEYGKTSVHPTSGKAQTMRRRIATNEDLPAGEAYESWIQQHFLQTP